VSTTIISEPLEGERVVALSPEDASHAATDWMRRPNFSPGRALTDLTLQGRQHRQAGRLAVRGQAFTSGITYGLESSFRVEGTGETVSQVRLFIEAGQGLAVSGEDVLLNRRMTCLLADVPVVMPTAWLAAETEARATTDAAVYSAVLHPREVGGRLLDVLAAAGDRMPDVGILLLQPVTLEVSDFDPDDPCDRCPTNEEDNLAAFEDWRIGDGVRLLWYPWPSEWQPLPTTQLRQRNALAHLIFAAEAGLVHGDALPWEEWGVPVALVGLEMGGDEPLVRYLDRAAVARQGGRAREARLMLSPAGSTALAASSRLPGLWQARIEQLAEQLAEMGDPPPDAATMADPFLNLPPCGLLPKSAIDLANFRSDFFPPSYSLDAVPVPIEQLDLAMREAAPMAPLDLAVPERVRLLVPVSQASWEPRLLFREVMDPEFQQTLDHFLLTRARLLGARQGLRAKEALLAHALDGQEHVVDHDGEDPRAVEPEGLSPWGPPPEGGGHRSKLASGMHQHYFIGADTPFGPPSRVSLSSLQVWVYLDPDNPPRTLMLQWHVAGGQWTRAYWGENLIEDDDLIAEDGASAPTPPLYIGDLPEAGRWVRLDMDVAGIGLAKASFDGMAFTLFDGRAAYGMASAAGTSPGPFLPDWSHVWLSGLPPAGASLQGNETWDLLSQNDLWAPFAARDGVYPILRDPTSSALIETVSAFDALMGDESLKGLSAHERSQLEVRGVQGFADYLRRRIDRADDITDFGFAHMQVDLYRVRNLVMSTSDASRLAVSPALAAIAASDSAIAVQSQIQEFVSKVKTKSVSLERASPARSLDARVTAPAYVSGAAASVSSTASTAQAMYSTTTNRLIQAPNAAPNIVYSEPVVGQFELHTTGIAERLKQPASANARDFALANRHRTVTSLLELLEEFLSEDNGEVPALFRDFDIFGLRGESFLEDDPSFRRPLLDFRADTDLLDKLMKSPPAHSIENGELIEVDPDESHHFSHTVSLSDNTIAILRQLEGRLLIYRDALARCETALAELLDNIGSNAQGLRGIEQDLAEARHDVSVTRALMSEEQARLDAINARRARVLEEEVQFLAFARPRQSVDPLAVPCRVVDPAPQEAPVPACLRAHTAVPEELEEMLRVVREAPAAWFARMPALLDKLERVDQLVRVVNGARERLPLLLDRTSAYTPVHDTLGKTIAEALSRQTAVITRRARTIGALDIDQLAMTNWQGIRIQVQEVVSLGDLIDGEHGKADVSRLASAEHDDFAAVSACLHAELCAVPSSIRLDWAETLSQFDVAPNLRNLANLPRWAEIDSSDRRQMQAYADWLFSQVDAREDAAVALINDVVRMCLLLASHAPVGRILIGRLLRPVTAVRPGIRIPLVSPEPDKMRVGMQAIVYRAEEIVARAVIEDIGPTEVSARVLYTSIPNIELDTNLCVHFDAAEVVSAAPNRISGVFKRQAPIWET